VSSSSEMLALAIGQALQLFLAQMKAFVPAQDIVRRVTRVQGNTGGSMYSEFKDVLQSMLVSYKYEQHLLESTLRLHQTNLHSLQARRIVMFRRAERFTCVDDGDEVDGFKACGGGTQLSTRQRPTRRLRDELQRSKCILADKILPCDSALNCPPSLDCLH
jgi:hypothetical protein